MTISPLARLPGQLRFTTSSPAHLAVSPKKHPRRWGARPLMRIRNPELSLDGQAGKKKKNGPFREVSSFSRFHERCAFRVVENGISREAKDLTPNVTSDHLPQSQRPPLPLSVQVTTFSAFCCTYGCVFLVEGTHTPDKNTKKTCWLPLGVPLNPPPKTWALKNKSHPSMDG